MNETKENVIKETSEEKPNLPEIVTKNMKPEQELEFAKTLKKLHLSENDFELFQLMRALQIYKAYYETIPERIEKAALSAEEIALKASIDVETMSVYLEGIAQKAGLAVERLGTDIGDRVRVTFNEIDNQVFKTGRELSEKLRETILAECENSLPLNKLKKAGNILNEAVSGCNRATTEMQKSIKLAKWTHYGVIAAAVLIVVLTSWICFHFHYTAKLSEERITIADQIDMNQAVLIELEKAGKKLEISKSAKNTKLLTIKDAEGVIEFK